MKIGDKVLVTYSNGDQFVGRIFGETAKSWKVEFDDGDQRTIRKTMDIEVLNEDADDETPVVEEVVTEETKPYEATVYTPTKRLKRNNLLILVGILAAAAVIAYFLVTALLF